MRDVVKEEEEEEEGGSKKVPPAFPPFSKEHLCKLEEEQEEEADEDEDDDGKAVDKERFGLWRRAEETTDPEERFAVLSLVPFARSLRQKEKEDGRPREDPNERVFYSDRSVEVKIAYIGKWKYFFNLLTALYSGV